MPGKVRVRKAQPASTGGDQDDLLQILTHQMDYIEQLEKENNFVKQELSSFKVRLENAVTENQNVHDFIRSAITSQTIEKGISVAVENAQEIEDEFATERKDVQKTNLPQVDSTNQAFEQGRREMENIKATYDAKIKDLQVELKITKKDLESSQAKGQEMTEVIARLNTLLRSPSSVAPAVTMKSLSHEPLDTNIPLIERLTKERDDILKSVSTTRESLMEAQKREAALRLELQRCSASIEDINLEKAQLKVQRDRLEKDLEFTQHQLKTEISGNQKRIAEASAQQRHACQQEMATLLNKVGELSASVTTYEKSLEETGREKESLAKKLQDTRRQLDLANGDLRKMRAEAEQEVRSAVKRNEEEEDKLREVKFKLQQELQAVNQEKIRLEQEWKERGQRLAAAEAEALAGKELNITLTGQLNAALHRFQDLRQENETLTEESRQNFANLQLESKEKEESLTQQIQRSEIAYEQRLSDLEGITSKQVNLIKLLKNQGKEMEAKLRSSKKKARSEIGALSTEREVTMARLARLLAANKELEEQVVQHGITHNEMQVRLRELNKRTERTNDYASSIMEQNDKLKLEKSLLLGEVEFLQSNI